MPLLYENITYEYNNSGTSSLWITGHIFYSVRRLGAATILEFKTSILHCLQMIK